jgi:hypothetical protein
MRLKALRALKDLTGSIAAGLVAASSDAWAQGTPQPPSVRMTAGLPPNTGWFLALLVCALLACVAWFVLCRKGPPPPPCAG